MSIVEKPVLSQPQSGHYFSELVSGHNEDKQDNLKSKRLSKYFCEAVSNRGNELREQHKNNMQPQKKIDNGTEINIKRTTYPFNKKQNYGLNEIDLDAILSNKAEELKSKVAVDPEVEKKLSVVVAKVYLSLKEKEYENRDTTKEKQQLQLACYISGNHTFDSVRISEIGVPYHPFEIELLDLIEKINELGTIPENMSPLDLINSSSKPVAFIPRRKGKPARGEDGSKYAVNFFQRHYHKYISSGVIYSDYLLKIDPKLYRNLRTSGLSKNELSELLPTKKDRLAKEKQILKDKETQLNVNKIQYLSKK